jgi:hypothetical protein
MRLAITGIALLILASASLRAEAPPNQVLVTPRNQGQFDFSVVLSVRGKARSFIVFAPPRTNGDCTPSMIGTELRTKDGQVIYSQTIELASVKPGPELRGQFEDSTQVLVLWISYFCPTAVGTRYVFSSADWEKAGLLQ